jgi:AcrR family transcriptional regulator
MDTETDAARGARAGADAGAGPDAGADADAGPGPDAGAGGGAADAAGIAAGVGSRIGADAEAGGGAPAGATGSAPERRRPGRRRSQDSRDAILLAAAELVVEHGYAAVSIEKIAQRAGVGKQTIYRWWPSKGDVIMEALARKADVHIPLPDEGSWAADLRRTLDDSFTLARAPQVAELLRALMVEAQLDPAFGARFRAEFLERRRAAVAVLVERAERRGDLPATLTAGFAADVLFGVLWYRLLAVPQPLDADLADRLAALLTAGG